MKLEDDFQEHLGGSVERLPSAQVMISGSSNQVPHRPPCSVGSLLLCPLLPLLICSLCQINKNPPSKKRFLCTNDLVLTVFFKIIYLEEVIKLVDDI